LFLGEYSCLKVELIFKREFSYYLITIYVPCCMLVIVSWVSFWLDPNAVPARVSLGVTTLLTMSTQTASINNSLPPVAYTKAIDVWTGVKHKIDFRSNFVANHIRIDCPMV
jgi:anionic glutamate receptor